ncbi:MAG: hypothetical protein AUJ37_00505 [Candidatus Magasanikbacteria bacterium CG1_02_41_34]|uniref:Glycosyltransferase 2-like domain-containing protein n=1 Tax=Candidatus Magasanikbacteria bacterium CG_4_10_14_0_2_um_filter_41_31 TaxID=1974639 RepID=A0A2M7V4W5_9BACT|nr:MAG: hypothetical protein AUJ37_00505 [Candidatus Magasanikbacteria bacterium CG1_02_41_34]PIZ93527.1 MAG: hypothetical protein COX83_01770 [Candidatus Magasanikbacteria bacterium CG_4_10_14_0_2_um_filter_41_31]
MKIYPKVGIVYLLYYHNESYVDDMVSSIKKLSYPRDRIELIIVVNLHPKEGSFTHYIEDTVMPLSEKELPRVTILSQTENLGFAGGNNVGTEWALEHECPYVFYHNNDGFMASNALEPIVDAMEADKTIGAAQSLMLLYPETDLVNSAGNVYQYLGFGYTDEYRTPVKELDLPPIKDVNYASGAALMVRADLIKKYGMWDHDFFLYHEDLEWSLRLRAVGYRIVLIRDSVFYHKYQFSRSIQKFYWMERNRIGVMLMYYKIPTFIVLFPVLVAMELGLWVFAFLGGWVSEHKKVYVYWMKKEHWKLWLGKRKKIQKMRTVSDRMLLKNAVSGIHFQDASVDKPIVNYVGNPVLALYYWVIVRLIIWW